MINHQLAAQIAALSPWLPFDVHAAGAEEDGTSWMEIDIDNVDFLFVHEPDEPHAFMAYGRLGVPAELHRSELLAAMLAANLTGARRGHASYGLETEADEVVYAFKAAFAHSAAGPLYDTLSQVSRQANEWIVRRWLDPLPEDPMQPSHPFPGTEALAAGI